MIKGILLSLTLLAIFYAHHQDGSMEVCKTKYSQEYCEENL